MIRTSYFAKYKEIEKVEGDVGVAVCLGASWWKGARYPLLAPTPEILNKWNNSLKEDKDIMEYQTEYITKVLNKLDVNTVANDLEGKVLLCFETPDKFCHRHLIADWFRKNGYDCQEIDMKKND